jgi:hypothetical protein
MTRIAMLLLLAATSNTHAAEPVLKPFVLASRGAGEPEEVAEPVRAKLVATGFEVAGSYVPYPNAIVLAVTSETLKDLAAQSEFGGYAAAQRVTITKVMNIRCAPDAIEDAIKNMVGL